MSDVYLAADLEAGAELACGARRYRISFFTWAGDLDPLDVIEIDVENVVVELNGVDDVSEFSGELFEILPGVNVLTYEDSEGSRTIQLTVVKRDRKA